MRGHNLCATLILLIVVIINLEGENIMCSMYEKETMHHVLCIIYYIHYIYIYI